MDRGLDDGEVLFELGEREPRSTTREKIRELIGRNTYAMQSVPAFHCTSLWDANTR